MTNVTRGSCNCGKISWQASGELRSILACHCSQCRKQTGSFYAATNVPDERLSIEGEDALRWYQSSSDAKRGFCSICGSALFWKRGDLNYTSLLVGSIDGETGLEISEHIFVSDKPDWYEITDGKPEKEMG